MTESETTRHTLRVLLVRWALRLFALLPLPLNHRIGAAVGWVGWLAPTRAKRVTLCNLERCYPELSFGAHSKMARNSLIEAGKTATEMGPLWLWPEKKIRKMVRVVNGEQKLHNALAGGKGVILAIPHLGAWEMVGLYCSLHYPVTALYRPPRLSQLDEMVRHSRERFGARLVPTEAGGVRKLFRALGRGEMVCILPDQVPSSGQWVYAPFFGIPARTMTLLPRLIQRFGSEVLFCHAERVPRGGGFRIHFTPAPEEIRDTDPVAAAAALNRGIEQHVRALPIQYQWSYKRFRGQPPGEPGFYE